LFLLDLNYSKKLLYVTCYNIGITFVLLIIMKYVFLISFVLSSTFIFGQKDKVVNLRIRPYTDSVKIVKLLSYYINVETIYANGKILPSTENELSFTTTYGTIQGMSIFFPDNLVAPDSILVSATYLPNKSISTSKWLYVQKVNKDELQNFEMLDTILVPQQPTINNEIITDTLKSVSTSGSTKKESKNNKANKRKKRTK
jgi:hypothetical protein